MRWPAQWRTYQRGMIRNGVSFICGVHRPRQLLARTLTWQTCHDKLSSIACAGLHRQLITGFIAYAQLARFYREQDYDHSQTAGPERYQYITLLGVTHKWKKVDTISTSFLGRLEVLTL